MVRLSANEQGHWLAGFKRCMEMSFGLIDADLDAPTTPLNAEGDTFPPGRKVRIDRYAVAAKRESSETEHRQHPDSALGRDMNAAGGAHPFSRKINGRRLVEEAQCGCGIA